MRFVVVGSMDPNEEAFWSGTPRAFVHALRQHGHEVTTIGPLRPEMPLIDWAKTKFYKRALNKFYQVDRNPAVLRARARHANRELAKYQDADAVIVLYPPDGAFLETSAPLVCIHDATWHLLIDFYLPDHARERLPKETLDGGYSLDRLGFANCDLVVMASQWAADSAIRDFGIPTDKLRVVNLAVNLPNPPKREEIEAHIAQRGQGPCRLLFIGYDWQRKGGVTALAATRELCARGLRSQLQIVGCSPDVTSNDPVEIFGRLSKKQPDQAAMLNQLFLKADFLILPTRADCYGMVLCEAAAHGLPVVTSVTGGVPSIVRDESWGIALPFAAPASEYASWIAAAYRDRARYSSLALAARRQYEERLNWGAFIRELCAAIKPLSRARAKTEPAAA